MRPAKPGAPLPAILLLVLALSPQGTQARPRGRRAARVPEPKPLLFLPAAGARPAPSPARSAEIFPRDLNLKDKFIKHFTGPVTFSAECSKHFHRLYHNTRDCSTPAYYKRCARLLTRLAVSPLCSQT
ncbi:ALK and LTK ligand 1 [Castor canadensis]|uniref:Protein FAM150A n=1 Tax=Castor canadensis TaxID=51338 RepID=A0A8C0W435_CASCN|nr:protein FAM150A [Castor canadensis]